MEETDVQVEVLTKDQERRSKLYNSHLPRIYYRKTYKDLDIDGDDRVYKLICMYKENHERLYKKRDPESATLGRYDNEFFIDGKGLNLIGNFKAEEALYVLYRSCVLNGECHSGNSVIGDPLYVLNFLKLAEEGRTYHTFIHSLFDTKLALEDNHISMLCWMLKRQIKNGGSLFVQAPYPLSSPKYIEYLSSKTSPSFVLAMQKYNQDFRVEHV